MDEKLYKAINASAVSGLVVGIGILVTGITSGILLIVNGARLIRHKSKILL